MTRILIVDDEAAASNILKMLIEKHIPPAKEIRTCNSPEEALDIIEVWQPHLLMLDIEMPKMDGLDFLEKLMRLRPMPVIMVSTLTEKGSDITYIINLLLPLFID